MCFVFGFVFYVMYVHELHYVMYVHELHTLLS